MAASESKCRIEIKQISRLPSFFSDCIWLVVMVSYLYSTPELLHLALESSVEERHGPVGAGQEKGH